MYDIEPVKLKSQGVELNVFERVPRLRIDINADNVKAGAVVAHGCATGPAKEVK